MTSIRVVERAEGRWVLEAPVNRVLSTTAAIFGLVALAAFGSALTSEPRTMRERKAQGEQVAGALAAGALGLGLLLGARGRVMVLDRAGRRFERRYTGPLGGQVREWPWDRPRLVTWTRTANGVTNAWFRIEVAGGASVAHGPWPAEPDDFQAGITAFLAEGAALPGGLSGGL